MNKSLNIVVFTLAIMANLLILLLFTQLGGTALYKAYTDDSMPCSEHFYNEETIST